VKWQKLDVIEKLGYGVWKVNKERRHLVLKQKKRVRKRHKDVQINDPCRSTGRGGSGDSKFVHLSGLSGVKLEQDSVASHGFMFVLRLPNLARWDKRGRRKYLEARKIEHEPISQGERLDTRLTKGWKVHLTGRSLVAYAPRGMRWYAETAAGGFREAFFEFLGIVRGVEKLLGVSFRMSGRYKVKTAREHHALIDNALAEQYTREGKKLYVRDERGLWALIDASVDPGEFETVRSGAGGREANRMVQDFFNGVKRTGITPEFILESIHGLAENARVFGENHAQHVRVLERMDETLKVLNKWMEENNGKRQM